MDRETVEEIKRHFGVLAERVESKIQVLAEALTSHRQEQKRDLAALEEHLTQRMDTVESVVRGHSAVLERHGQMLERHGQMLERHGQMLERHGQMLESHGQVLERHEQALERHGEQLQRIEQKLDRKTDVESVAALESRVARLEGGRR